MIFWVSLEVSSRRNSSVWCRWSERSRRIDSSARWIRRESNIHELVASSCVEATRPSGGEPGKAGAPPGEARARRWTGQTRQDATRRNGTPKPCREQGCGRSSARCSLLLNDLWPSFTRKLVQSPAISTLVKPKERRTLLHFCDLLPWKTFLKLPPR